MREDEFKRVMSQLLNANTISGRRVVERRVGVVWVGVEVNVVKATGQMCCLHKHITTW